MTSLTGEVGDKVEKFDVEGLSVSSLFDIIE